MAKLPYGWWTAYRKHYARTQLRRGDSRELVASRLGCSDTQLRDAISNHYLLSPRHETDRMDLDAADA